ncbi:hypothetical protein [Neobacillus niacini]|uniref:hypothetical protein n=1 Tax=Neobacillus niacini TaxID=86668 RepID=UPI0021CB15F1|nr:hypothetical protein [Neobacillus niacini]MCM3763787.1 hypothetical protein [Neobacillus niacini]
MSNREFLKDKMDVEVENVSNRKLLIDKTEAKSRNLSNRRLLIDKMEAKSRNLSNRRLLIDKTEAKIRNLSNRRFLIDKMEAKSRNLSNRRLLIDKMNAKSRNLSNRRLLIDKTEVKIRKLSNRRLLIDKTFGPINLYIASIFLPLFIIHLWKLALSTHEFYVIGLTFIVLVILLFHPDAGQVTAFACATAIIFWKKINNRMIKLFTLTLITTMVIVSWIFLDNLAPVPYVEKILFLAADMGIVWFVLGVLSLLLLVVPFFFIGKVSIVSLSLGVYFLLTMIVTFFGNFPMPIMGYGVSPIIGYLIAITWLKNIKTTIFNKRIVVF